MNQGQQRLARLEQQVLLPYKRWVQVLHARLSEPDKWAMGEGIFQALIQAGLIPPLDANNRPWYVVLRDEPNVFWCWHTSLRANAAVIQEALAQRMAQGAPPLLTPLFEAWERRILGQ